MAFYSILFPSPAQESKALDCPWLSFRPRSREREETVTRGNKTYAADKYNFAPGPAIPAFFADTGLDSVLDAVLNGGADNALRRVYAGLAADAATVQYRQEIMRALASADTGNALRSFCGAVESAARTIAEGQTVHDAAQRDKYTADGAAAYCAAVRELLAAACRREFEAEGLRLWIDAVRAYAAGPRFTEAEALLRRAKDAVESISFRLKIRKGKVLVSPDVPGGDFVRQTRADFTVTEETGTADESRLGISLFGELALCPLGIRIAEALRKEHADAFALLRRAADAARGMPDPMTLVFVKDVRFYFSYLDMMRAMVAKGLPFAYPVLSEADAVRIDGAYDLDLALRQDFVVRNDCLLSEAERGIVVTGANHSGKTTYIRALGQIAALAALGLPIPCERAELPLFSGFFSHFSDAEEGAAEQGRLKEELVKLKPILGAAGSGSLVLLNEMFSSTTAQDAQAMSSQVVGGLMACGARVLWVTHTLGSVPEGMVSMAAQIAQDSHERLYTVIRAPAVKHAHVDALMAKYRLTREDVKERIVHGS